MLPASFTPQFLRQLELFKLHARRSFLGTREGGHLSVKRGHGIVFSDYRKYEYGDNPRHIDWGLYARSDRLYVKRFQEEQDLRVNIIIDASSSMFIPADEHKWRVARDLALTISYVALMSQDSVFLSVPGLYESSICHGGRSIHTLGSDLLKLSSQGLSDFEAHALRMAKKIRFPGLAIVISDFLMPIPSIEKIFGTLRARNLDLTALQVLGPGDILPLENEPHAIAVDSESGQEIELLMNTDTQVQYTHLLNKHTEKLVNYFNSARIAYSLVLAHKATPEHLLSGLSSTGLIQ